MTIQSMNFGGENTLGVDNIPTYDEIVSLIDGLELDAELKDLLKRKAKRMPPGSYLYFVKNINYYINNTR